MRTYLIEDPEYPSIQARVVMMPNGWQFVAQDIMVCLGFNENEACEGSEEIAGWSKVHLDTSLGKRVEYVIDDFAIEQLCKESSLDEVSLLEFIEWYDTVSELLGQEEICSRDTEAIFIQQLTNMEANINQFHDFLLEQNTCRECSQKDSSGTDNDTVTE